MIQNQPPLLSNVVVQTRSHLLVQCFRIDMDLFICRGILIFGSIHLARMRVVTATFEVLWAGCEYSDVSKSRLGTM